MSVVAMRQAFVATALYYSEVTALSFRIDKVPGGSLGTFVMAVRAADNTDQND